MGDPRVSVCMTTYNQEAFIAQAVESVLAQEVDFPIEILVSEDHGQDRTREILERLDRCHPGRLRLFFRERNLGATRNFLTALAECRGEYIATLDGDDYWSHPRKLASQVALMDANPGLSMCGHRYRIFSSVEGAQPERISPRRREHIELRNVILGHYVVPCTMVFRRAMVPEIPDWYASNRLGDWCLEFLCATRGPIRFVNEVMAVYREHRAGIWSGATVEENHLTRLEVLDLFRSYLGSGCEREFRRARAVELRELSWLYKELGRTAEARRTAARAVRTDPSFRWFSPRSVRWMAGILLGHPRGRVSAGGDPGAADPR